ncbi:hypothetical protein [Gallaecimonas xiamenensis]|uniref:Phasin domain-containing protein n=1 Tax=Gallaecimonas xiamenensis 3-C-1 TaxID=745411 RepID=K2IZV9_9GAMM|nr:hypothetical protein [Gallaecimonas xiamenensis]EKE68092.1 hypothetical protein B3C1_17387 [Gallaecimonas xiamenensis 3-C-1]
MNAFKAEDFVDPSLTQALAEWKDFYSHSLTKGFDLFNAYAPIKDAVQASETFLASVKDLNWKPDLDGFAKAPALDSEALAELTELQNSSTAKLWDHYNQSLKATQAYGESLVALAKEPKTPQVMMAGYLSSTLDAVKQYQAGLNAQLATLSEIQGAYKGWFEKACLDKSSPAPAKAPAKAAAKKEPATA